MKILIACEESQAICIEMRKLWHEAYSCDIQECSWGHPEWHIQVDAIEVAYREHWDMMIAHPPCTDLAVSGARHFARKIADGSQQRSIDFFLKRECTDWKNRYRKSGLYHEFQIPKARPNHTTMAILTWRNEINLSMDQGAPEARTYRDSRRTGTKCMENGSRTNESEDEVKDLSVNRSCHSWAMVKYILTTHPLKITTKPCKNCQKEMPKWLANTCSPKCFEKLKKTKEKEKRKIDREKKAISVSALGKKADTLWSIVIRQAGACEYCGKTENLNAHHIFGRNNKSVRWEVSNGICLCAGCHTFSSVFSAHKNPYLFSKWLEEYKWMDYMGKLTQLSQIPIKVTPDILKEYIDTFNYILEN